MKYIHCEIILYYVILVTYKTSCQYYLFITVSKNKQLCQLLLHVIHFIIPLHFPIILTKWSCHSIFCLHCSVLGKAVCFLIFFLLHLALSVLLITPRWHLHACLKHKLSSPQLSGVSIARSLVFCVVFCRSLFVF